MTAATTPLAHASAPLPRGLALILRFLSALLHTGLGRRLRPAQVCRIYTCLAGTTSCPYALARKDLPARPAPSAPAVASQAVAARRPRPRRRSHAAPAPAILRGAAPCHRSRPSAAAAAATGAPAPSAPPRAPRPRPPPSPPVPPRLTQRA